jgi:hypothetical protein
MQTSQYTGVSWHDRSKKWCVQFKLKGEKQKYGGVYIEELDAAKKVNQLCEEFGIPPKNPVISVMPNQPVRIQVTCSTLNYYRASELNCTSWKVFSIHKII